MRLPELPRAEQKGVSRLEQFGGINLQQTIQDGELQAGRHLSTEHYPFLGPCPGHVTIQQYERPTALFEWDGHLVVADGGKLYLDGDFIANVETGEKQFAVVNTKLVVWPDRIWVDLTNSRVHDMTGAIPFDYSKLTGNQMKILSAGIVPNVEMFPEFGSDSSQVPWVDTYGKDKAAIGWSEEAGWTLPEPVIKSAIKTSKHPSVEVGDIVIPRVELSGATGQIGADWPGYVWSEDAPASVPEPDRNELGYYGVVTRVDVDDGYTEIRAGIRRVGADAPIASDYYAVGQKVNIEGGLLLANRREGVEITAVENAAETGAESSLTFADNTFLSPARYIDVSRDYGSEKIYTNVADGTRNIYVTGTDVKQGDQIYQFEAGFQWNFGGISKQYQDGWYHWSAERKTLTKMVEGHWNPEGAAHTTERSHLYRQGDKQDARAVNPLPELDYICARDNRLYGVSNATSNRIYDQATGKTNEFTSRCIYVSARGLPDRFFDFDGTDEDSFQAAEGTEGDFTGICSYGGSVLCWKENRMIRLYGDYPSSFQTYTYEFEGVQKGSYKSLVVLNEVLYYKGRNGIYQYSGSIPGEIGYKLGDTRYYDAAAGEDGQRYWISMRDEDGNWKTFDYDTVTGLWMIETEEKTSDFARVGDYLYGMLSDRVTALNCRSLTVNGAVLTAPKPEWYAELAVITEGILERKSYKWISLRVELAAGSSIQTELAIGDFTFRKIYESEQDGWWTCRIPLPPMRVDRVVLKLSGTGWCQIRAVERVYHMGSQV